MKKKLFILFAFAAVLVSCSDKIYEEINTDPTKVSQANPSAQLTFAELELFGDMNYVDVHRLYTYAFTQHLMGCWNTTFYGGQHRTDDNEMSRPWNNLYPGAIRNLTDAISQTKDDANQANVQAALRILRVYVGGLLTDYYGDVPYTDAGLGYIAEDVTPVYDKQEDIYRSFFEELKAAVKLFNNDAASITSDPMFEGNLAAWRLFANSLRLRYAMRISDILPDLAEAEFKAALEDGVMSSAADDACVKHMNVSYSFGQESYRDFRGNALSKYFFGNDPTNNPTYICQTFWDQLYKTNDPRMTRLCRFYIDDYISLSTGDGRIDMTDAVVATQLANPADKVIWLIAPGKFSWDNWPDYSQAAVTGSPLVTAVDQVIAANPGYDPASNPRWLMPKIAINFLRSDNPGVLMTYAEVCFLRAEAAVYHWTGDNAKQMYEEGIRASMDFLANHYGCEAITDGEYAAYLAEPTVAWGAVKEQQKSQINTQAWILHFHNPAEAWANQRRSDAPTLATPDISDMIDGNTATPVRLCYPQSEAKNNQSEYEAAKARVEGGYSWNARLWWDTK